MKPPMMTLFVRNFPYSTTEQDLRELFGEYGALGTVRVPVDEEKQRARGYGFVEMERAAGERAIEQLNGVSWGGRELQIREADPPFLFCAS